MEKSKLRRDLRNGIRNFFFFLLNFAEFIEP